MNETEIQDRVRGILLGTAVGDALGLPAEGLSRKSIEKLGWSNWRHRLIFGRGMLSDDTEHTLFVTQALLKYDSDPVAFQKSMAWKLKWWLLGIPAGIGFGTLRAILKLWVGFSPNKSGVYSAGNGPAMRCAIIGARFADDENSLREFTKRSTVITHCDQRALTGALAISYAAKYALQNSPEDASFHFEILSVLENLSSDDEWLEIIGKMKECLKDKKSLDEYVAELGISKGVSGYIYHTVPVAIYAWLINTGDFRKTMTDVLNCGGDTDTVGAIAGALAGASSGESDIPAEWINGIIEYPRTCNILRQAADNMTKRVTGSDTAPVSFFFPALVLRNIFFTIIVLTHGFLRMLPAQIRKIIIK